MIYILKINGKGGGKIVRLGFINSTFYINKLLAGDAKEEGDCGIIPFRFTSII